MENKKFNYETKCQSGKLLGKPTIPSSNYESTVIIQNELYIKKGIFTIEEFKKATKAYNMKNWWLTDEIPAKVQKLEEFQ